jgi:cytochrome b6-f complex iron-sulfur subunit
MGKMSRSDKLPVLPPTEDSETCGGCDRRDVLAGLAAASLLPLGCGGGGGDDTPLVDAAPPADPGFEMCGTNVCVDLTKEANSGLLNAGGSRVITSGTKKIIIVRSSDTEFVTLSPICTHQGCTVAYQLSGNNFRCPCHGSQYDIAGAVTMGPAQADLTPFSNTFDMAGNLLTIMLT